MNRFRRTVAFAFVLVLAGIGCTPKPGDAPTEPDAVKGLEFIENDYPGALALARESNLPLFVEVWAPW
jgi:hypothetical protein